MQFVSVADQQVDTWSTEKRVDRMKNDDWPKDFFYQKPYVLYGIIATSEPIFFCQL